MPRPVGPDSRYLPGLDGLRAIAVLLVLGYHFGVPGLDGGLLGVSIFFTLSGFLITGILAGSWRRDGRLGLRRFYLARARRLLPALAVVLLTVLAVTALVEPEHLALRWRQTIAATLYVSNWETIHSGDSYFGLAGGPGPLDHLWSLAVEEQFYLVWPVLLLVLLRLNRGRLSRVARVAVGLATVAFVLQAVLAHGGFDNTRAYEGTDTRAGELLVGAALALFYRPGRIRRPPPLPVRAAVDVAGLAALAGIGLLVSGTPSYSVSLYRGGLLGLSLLTAVVLFAVTYPGSLCGRLLGPPPLRWIGERSYGIYLWHLPVVAFTLRPGTGGSWLWPALLDLGLTVLLASLSWRLLEDPVRRHGLRSLIARPEPGRDHSRVRRPVALGGLLVAMAAVTSFTPVSAFSDRGDDLAAVADDPAAEPPPPQSAGTPSPAATSAPPTSRASGPAPRPRPVATAAGRLSTGCTQVVHVGDSTSIGLMSPAYLPDARDRIDARYRAVGVRAVQTDILGARSIVERYKGQPNAQDATRARVEDGYRGCWVFALGTNEAANVAVGSAVGLDERIDLIMNEIGDRPALWLTVRTVRTSGPWAESQMRKWNTALTAACARYPMMRVYDWAARVQDGWFISDGIHFTSTGNRERARRTATALATAFPASGPRPGCLVTG